MTLSEPQLISPLLDGFVMGDAISYHHGIQCCPAMRLETSEKYIVKIISVPATQARLDALLLAGAFSDTESALDYFKELADGVVEEAALLQKLSRFEGYVSYEDWQLVPMEYGTGFDIYLLGAYRPTLDGQIDRSELTHLGAVNLGLDLCAALSVARRFGHIYADLQPSNIYICGDREYRIGDLGFISLDSLEFASLPDKYRSSYTPPEISDAYSALNTTIDTYAVGMILYQAYNDGRLPPVGMPLQAPKYADPALSEIILKACDLDPQQRWEDPMQMGQALINYLQCNSVNDVPIVPLEPEEEAEEEPVAEDDGEPSTEEILAEVDEALVAVPLLAVPEDAEEPEADPAEDTEETEESTDTDEPAEGEQEEAAVSDEDTAEEDTDSAVEVEAAEVAGEAEANDTDDMSEASSDDEDAEFFEVVSEDPGEEVESDASDEESADEAEEDDVHEILAQADDIISHELPTPVIEIQPIELVIPEQPAQEEEPAQDDAAASEEAEAAASEEAEAKEEPEGDEAKEETNAPVKKRSRGLIATVITLSIVILLLLGGYLFYEHYYLQVINDIVLSGSEDKLTVTLNTGVADEKLTIICTDTYGNSMRRPVVKKTASFEGLKAGTTYKLQVRIDGFHKLLGETTESYTTAQQTTIGNFFASTGPEDGSVILSFTVQGPDANQWNVHYQAEGEDAQSATFAGHMVTLTGLTVGKEYTFTLEPSVELYVNGTESITYVPRKIVMADNLQILGIKNHALNVAWTVPADASVSEWTVRCYNDAGFDQTVTTSELSAVFENIDPALGYTVEVTAEGMTVGTRTYLSANSVTVFDIGIDTPNRNHLKVQWSFEGTAPADGWLLLYTVDGSTEQKVVKCEQTDGFISPLIPGANYSISIQPANGATVFGGTVEYRAAEAPAFSGYGVKADDIRFEMCITPKVQNWDRYDVPSKNYTTSFKVGSSASFVMRLTRDYTTSNDEIVTLFVVRDSEGKIISNATEARTWKSMWYRSYGKLTLPFLPDQPGNYSVSIYFNGTAATSRNFTVVAAE